MVGSHRALVSGRAWQRVAWELALALLVESRNKAHIRWREEDACWLEGGAKQAVWDAWTSNWNPRTAGTYDWTVTDAPAILRLSLSPSFTLALCTQITVTTQRGRRLLPLRAGNHGFFVDLSLKCPGIGQFQEKILIGLSFKLSVDFGPIIYSQEVGPLGNAVALSGNGCGHKGKDLKRKTTGLLSCKGRYWVDKTRCGYTALLDEQAVQQIQGGCRNQRICHPEKHRFRGSKHQSMP